MSKSTRLEALVEMLTGSTQVDAEACYGAYFICFNAARYYEAHDVLEHVWLKLPTEDGGFFKGLIQFSGAFVHLQKQYLRPHHYKFEGRLKPAKRLLRCAAKNLQAYSPEWMKLDVVAVLKVCELLEREIATGNYLRNPWRPESAPHFKRGGRMQIWHLEYPLAL